MDKTAVALGAFSSIGIVTVALAPGDPQTKSIAFTALAPMGGAAGGMVMPHVGQSTPRRRLSVAEPMTNPPDFSA